VVGLVVGEADRGWGGGVVGASARKLREEVGDVEAI